LPLDEVDEPLVPLENVAQTDLGVLVTPRIPCGHALLEQCDVLVVRTSEYSGAGADIHGDASAMQWPGDRCQTPKSISGWCSTGWL
jgi:hypothetical protein